MLGVLDYYVKRKQGAQSIFRNICKGHQLVNLFILNGSVDFCEVFVVRGRTLSPLIGKILIPWLCCFSNGSVCQIVLMPWSRQQPGRLEVNFIWKCNGTKFSSLTPDPFPS